MNEVKQFLDNVFGFTYRFIKKVWQLFIGFLSYISHKSVRLGDVVMLAMALVIVVCGFVVVAVDDEWMRCIAFCGALLQTFAMGMLSSDMIRTSRKE